MTITRWHVLGVALTAAMAAAVIALAGLVGRGGDDEMPVDRAQPVTVDASISPETHRFGDMTRARLDVRADGRLVDLDSVRVQASFSPYRAARPVERRLSDTGGETVIRYEFALSCLDFRCVPRQNEASSVFVFPRVRVSFLRSGGEAASRGNRQIVTASWPSIRVTTRVTPEELRRIRFFVGLDPLPAVSFRMDADLLFSLLAAAALLAGLAGLGALAYALVPYQRFTAPQAEAWVRRLSPLELALALVRRALAERRREEQRKALERLGRELSACGRVDLAADARHLAWSREGPSRAAGTLCQAVERVITEGA